MGHPSHPSRQARTVVALSVTIAVLLTLWVVGTFLLINYTPSLDELPADGASPTASE
jgi:hypothetical protein